MHRTLDEEPVCLPYRSASRCQLLSSDDLAPIHGTSSSLGNGIQNYGSAIRRSTGTADVGAQFAEEAKVLCTYLMDQGTPIESVRNHISRMRSLAKDAHQKAVDTSAEIRAVRESFHQVSKVV
jgi:hypothetical protein